MGTLAQSGCSLNAEAVCIEMLAFVCMARLSFGCTERCMRKEASEHVGNSIYHADSAGDGWLWRWDGMRCGGLFVGSPLLVVLEAPV